MKNYACYKLCCVLIAVSGVALLMTCVFGYWYGVVNEHHVCGLKSHSYIVTKPYSMILKALQNFPAGCVYNIKKVTITNSSVLAATLEVLWV